MIQQQRRLLLPSSFMTTTTSTTTKATTQWINFIRTTLYNKNNTTSKISSNSSSSHQHRQFHIGRINNNSSYRSTTQLLSSSLLPTTDTTNHHPLYLFKQQQQQQQRPQQYNNTIKNRSIFTTTAITTTKSIFYDVPYIIHHHRSLSVSSSTSNKDTDHKDTEHVDEVQPSSSTNESNDTIVDNVTTIQAASDDVSDENENNNTDNTEEDEVIDVNTPTVKLYPVYTRYDIEDLLQSEQESIKNGTINYNMKYEDDTSIAIIAKFDINHINQQLYKQLGIVKDIQYHNGIEWLPLQTQKDVDILHESLKNNVPLQYNRLVPIKIPLYYDEFTHDDNDKEIDNENEYEHENNKQQKYNKNVMDEYNDPKNEMDENELFQKNHDTLQSNSQFMNYIPGRKSDPNKHEQALLNLAMVVEQLIQLLHDPNCPYEKLYNYTTTNTPQRLVLKHSKMKQQHDIQKKIEIEMMNNIGNDNNNNHNHTDDNNTDDNSMDQKEAEDILNNNSNTDNNDNNNDTYYEEDDGYSIDTRVWIMEQATNENMKNDPVMAANLRNVLMQYPHALDHIANCIHMFDLNARTTTPTSTSSSTTTTTNTSTTDDNDNNNSTTKNQISATQ